MLASMQDSGRPFTGHIPAEVLCVIFSLCCNDGIVVSYPFAPMAVTLTRVCSYWRQEAIGLQSLWSYLIYDMASGYEIGVAIIEPEEDRWERIRSATTTCLERAGNHALSLEFRRFNDAEIGRLPTRLLNRTLKLLCNRSEVWESLSMSVSLRFRDLPALRVLQKKGLPQLRVLEVIDNSESSSSSSDSDSDALENRRKPFDIDFLGALPALESVDLRLIESPGYKVVGLPLHQLKHFRLMSGPTSNQFPLSLVSSCTNITSLHLRSECPDYRHNVSLIPPICNLPLLKILRLRALNGLFTDILPFIAISPNLSTLDIYHSWYTSRLLTSQDATALFTFLQRSNGSITSLTLWNVVLNDEDMFHLLHLVPNLKTLQIIDFIVVGATYRSLQFLYSTNPQPALPYLPFLTKVKFHLGVDGPSEALRVCEAIKSRLRPNPSLSIDGFQTVELELTEEIGQAVEMSRPGCLSELLSLAEYGLRISVKYHLISRYGPKRTIK